MIITRTPFRISFAGGGSDIKNYYEKYSGAVLSATINKYMYLSMHPHFKDNVFFLKYLMQEYTDNVNKIKHPIIKEIFKKYNISGVDFNSSSDIPASTGLASSSAFTVGLINLCTAYKNIQISKDEIAKLSCEIEIDKLKSPIGKQDQYACSFGGINFIKFNKDETVSVQKLSLKPTYIKTLENNLLLFYTGKTRSGESILIEQSKNIVNDSKKTKNIHKMVELAKNLKDELTNGNINSMGEILHTGWMYKKELVSGISDADIDNMYNIAIENGASGGKLLGAGGGGFLLFYADKKYHSNIRKVLSNQKEIKFKFDSIGTKIIYNKQ